MAANSKPELTVVIDDWCNRKWFDVKKYVPNKDCDCAIIFENEYFEIIHATGSYQAKEAKWWRWDDRGIQWPLCEDEELLYWYPLPSDPEDLE